MEAESAIRARFVRAWFTGVKGVAITPWLPSHCDTDTSFDAPAGPCAGGGGFDAHLV